jgi:hypothetical protein
MLEAAAVVKELGRPNLEHIDGIVVIGPCRLRRVHMESEEPCADAASTLYGSLFSSLCGSSKAGS